MDINIGQKGFSLLEVMIALSLLAVGLLSIIIMVQYSIISNAKGRNMTEATVLAQSHLEVNVGGTAYNNLKNYTTSRLNADGSTNVTGGRYKVFCKVTSISTTLDVKKIDIAVKWKASEKNGGGFITHTVQINSLRARDN
jgi:prepilin-type N-terminal cleavage/methylation domain-containing protein